MSGVRRVLAAVGRVLFLGLRGLGFLHVVDAHRRYTEAEQEAARIPERPAPRSEPPEGHPERMEPDARPDEDEQHLWDQLAGLDDWAGIEVGRADRARTRDGIPADDRGNDDRRI